MISRQEIYKKAGTAIDARRSKSLKDYELRKAEIQQNYPSIDSLRRSLSATGIELAKHILSGKVDAEQSVAIIKSTNQSLQKQLKEALAAAGLSADYLVPKYTCDKCEDTGLTETGRCSCFSAVLTQTAIAEFQKDVPLKLHSFESFKLSYYPAESQNAMKEILSRCASYAKSFSPSTSGNLFFVGTPGLGKTHLSLAIADEVIKAGYLAVYASAGDILRRLGDERFSYGKDENILFETLTGADLLILDDLGTEFKTNFSTSNLYDIINTRLSKNLPMIINSNLDGEELARAYSPAIISRLSGFSIYTFEGEDIRRKI